MNVLEGIEAFKDGLMWICLSALAAIAVGVVGAWLYRGVASAMRRPLAVARLAAFVVVSAFCVIRGGAKFLMPPPTTGGTPVVPVMQSPATSGTPVIPEVVTPEEIAQGWRLESVVTNDVVSYAMPTNGVEYMPWSLGGGYEMHFPLDLGDFAFPFGTGMVRRLDVLSGGMVESLPRQRVEGPYSSAMSICAAREWASIVPGVGRFWWAEAVTAVAGRPPYRGKILTWEGVYFTTTAISLRDLTTWNGCIGACCRSTSIMTDCRMTLIPRRRCLLCRLNGTSRKNGRQWLFRRTPPR